MRELYSDMKPSAKKVIKAIQATPINDCEEQSFDLPKKYVRLLDGPSLKIFLKCVTGSDALVTYNISVPFTAMDGMVRRPIAHTCGPSLDVPSFYQSYNEMAEEFNNIQRRRESWTFNII